jgi:hypothetical protein
MRAGGAPDPAARRGVCIFENLALEELAASGHHRFEFV